MILFFTISFIIEDFYTLVNKSEAVRCTVSCTKCVSYMKSLYFYHFTFPVSDGILYPFGDTGAESEGNTYVPFMGKNMER